MAKTDSVYTHKIIMEERCKVRITGVTDIDSFTESRIVLNTVMGELIIKGSDIHVSELITETGDISVHGEISGLAYTTFKANAGLIRRLFR